LSALNQRPVEGSIRKTGLALFFPPTQSKIQALQSSGRCILRCCNRIAFAISNVARQYIPATAALGPGKRRNDVEALALSLFVVGRDVFRWAG
jgi:hypothetical protein